MQIHLNIIKRCESMRDLKKDIHQKDRCNQLDHKLLVQTDGEVGIIKKAHGRVTKERSTGRDMFGPCCQ